MKTITVATFNEREPATSVSRRLEGAGIPTVIHDAARLQHLFRAKPFARLHVEVDRKDFERAEQLLAQWDQSEGLMREAVRCPQCGSSRVEYPQLTRKFVTPSFHLGLALMLGLVKKEFYCECCQYAWPAEEPVDVPRDRLGWPIRPIPKPFPTKRS